MRFNGNAYRFSIFLRFSVLFHCIVIIINTIKVEQPFSDKGTDSLGNQSFLFYYCGVIFFATLIVARGNHHGMGSPLP